MSPNTSTNLMDSYSKEVTGEKLTQKQKKKRDQARVLARAQKANEFAKTRNNKKKKLSTIGMREKNSAALVQQFKLGQSEAKTLSFQKAQQEKKVLELNRKQKVLEEERKQVGERIKEASTA